MKKKLTIFIYDFNNFKQYVKVSYIKNMETYYKLERLINPFEGNKNYFIGWDEIIITIYEPHLLKPAFLIWQEGMHGACGISMADKYVMPVCTGNPEFQKLFNNEQWTLALELCEGISRQKMSDNHNMPFNTMRKRIEAVYNIADIPGFKSLSNHEKGVRFIEFMIEMGVYIKPD